MNKYAIHFEVRLKQFIQFKKNNGKWPDEHSIDPIERSLGTWARKAKLAYNNGTLNESRKSALLKIKFPLNDYEDKWNRKLNSLKKFVLKKKRLPSPGEELYHFSNYNHRIYDKLDHERKKLLDSFGFTTLWDKKDFDVVWEKKLNDLVIFYRKHNRFPTRKDNSSLGPWVIDQRQRLKEGKLSKKQKSMLKKEKINLLATSRIRRFKNGDAWDGNFDLVASFIKKKGRVPKHTVNHSEERRLYNWLMNQNWPIKKGILSAEKIEKLKSLICNCSQTEDASFSLLNKALKFKKVEMHQSNNNV